MKTHQHSRILSRKAESGQAIILMALMMIGLLAATGLAVDGGGMFFLWRDVRNAADAAVLAGSFVRCANLNIAETTLEQRIREAGQNAAAMNGFEDPLPDDVNAGMPNVVVNYPPTRGEKAGVENYIEVMITAEKPAYFIQIIYPQPLQVTGYAVGNCKPRLSKEAVSGIMALGNCDFRTVDFSGANATFITDIFSNDGVYINGNAANPVQFTGHISANGPIDDGGQKIIYNGQGSGSTTPVPERGNPLEAVMNIDDWRPGGAAVKDLTNYRSFTGTWKPSGEQNGVVFVDGDVHGKVQSTTKGITIIATGTIQLTGGPDIKHYVEDPITGTGGRGILVWSNEKPANPCSGWSLKFTGGQRARGLIYVPYGPIDFSFPSGDFKGALIAHMVDFHGSSMRYEYDSSIIPARPGFVSISE